MCPQNQCLQDFGYLWPFCIWFYIHLYGNLLDKTCEEVNSWIPACSHCTGRISLCFYQEIVSAHCAHCGHHLVLPNIFDVPVDKLMRLNICWYILLATRVSSFVNCLFKHFALFSLGVFVFPPLFIKKKKTLWILEILTLCYLNSKFFFFEKNI